MNFLFRFIEKNYLIIRVIFLIFFINSTYAQEIIKKEKNKKNYELLGRVKYFKEQTYHFNNFKKEEKILSNELFVCFDKFGNKIKEKRYNKDKVIELNKKWKYNRKEQLIEILDYYEDKYLDQKFVYRYNLNNKLIEIKRSSNFLLEKEENKLMSCKYHNNGMLKEENFYRINSGKLEIKKKYNKKGFLIEIDDFDWSGINIFERYIPVFDEKGNKIEESFYYAGKSIPSDKRIYKYDIYNNLIEKKSYDLEGFKEKVIFGNYDFKGNFLSKCITYVDDMFEYKTFLKYDSTFNKIIEIIYKTNNEITRKIVFKYDKFGNQIEELNESYDSIFRPQIKTTEYEFDKFGNWIKLTFYNNERPVYYSERKIKYFIY
jgi:hypothetical protein